MSIGGCSRLFDPAVGALSNYAHIIRIESYFFLSFFIVSMCFTFLFSSYVSRAFSTLEGIGLSINEDYSILQECYPYLAKRLLTDNSPRARNALQAMLYGSTMPSSTGSASSTLEPWTTNSYADQASHNAYFKNHASGAAAATSGGAAFAAAGVAAAAQANNNNNNNNEADVAAAEAAAAGGAARRRQRLGRSALGGGLIGAGSNSGSVIDIASSSESIVGAGIASGAGGSGNLQAKKVVEMGQGFASYTTATSDADAGKGVAEALNSTLDLLLADDADPNFVQEVRFFSLLCT